MYPRKLQVGLVILLLASGVLVSATIDRGLAEPDSIPAAQSALDAATLSIEHRAGRVSLQGMSASADHEAGLQQIIMEQFGQADPMMSLRAGVLVPERWETSSMRLLYALAVTESARADMSDGLIRIRGVTSDTDSLASRLEFLREGALASTTIEQDIVVVPAAASLDALCRRNFTHVTRERVAFRQSSTEIRTSSYAVLDKIIDVANDCRDSLVAIAGHSDASGNETWNRQLSLARAQSVADYFTRGGIRPDRLRVSGLGSKEPIADNATAQGRSLNRRIEFGLSQPSP